MFASVRAGPPDLYLKDTNGAGQDELLLKSAHAKFPSDWSRDGRFLLYAESGVKSGPDLWVLNIDGERKPAPFLQTPFNETQGQFSPDSRWIAYASDESGRSEIYVQAFPAAAGKFQISADGGDEPSWRADGRELYFLSPDQKLMAVEVSDGAGFEAGTPKTLFRIHAKSSSLTGARSVYCAAPDGKRFLVNQLGAETAVSPITVVLNWTSDLSK